MDKKEKIKSLRKEIREFQKNIDVLKKKIKALQEECEMELKNFLEE